MLIVNLGCKLQPTERLNLVGMHVEIQWMSMLHHELYHHLHYDYATSNDTNCGMMALQTFMMEDHWKMRVQSQHSAPTSGRLLSRE